MRDGDTSAFCPTGPDAGLFLSGDLSYIYADKTEKYAISHAYNGVIPDMRLLCPQ